MSCHNARCSGTMNDKYLGVSSNCHLKEDKENNNYNINCAYIICLDNFLSKRDYHDMNYNYQPMPVLSQAPNSYHRLMQTCRGRSKMSIPATIYLSPADNHAWFGSILRGHQLLSTDIYLIHSYSTRSVQVGTWSQNCEEVKYCCPVNLDDSRVSIVLKHHIFNCQDYHQFSNRRLLERINDCLQFSFLYLLHCYLMVQLEDKQS